MGPRAASGPEGGAAAAAAVPQVLWVHYEALQASPRSEEARIAAEETGRGIAQIQVKLGADRDNEADIARLRKVREAVPAGTLVYGDWNCGASRLDATRVGRAVADLDIML